MCDEGCDARHDDVKCFHSDRTCDNTAQDGMSGPLPLPIPSPKQKQSPDGKTGSDESSSLSEPQNWENVEEDFAVEWLLMEQNGQVLAEKPSLTCIQKVIAFIRAWLSFLGVVTIWTGVWALLDDYLYLPSIERDVIYMIAGLSLMWVTKTLVWNSEAYRPVYRQDQLPPPSCSFYCVAVYSLAALAGSLSCAGTILYWVGLWDLIGLLPGMSPGHATAGWLCFSIQLVSLIILVAMRALFGAGNSRGNLQFAVDADTQLDGGTLLTSQAQIRQRHPDWEAWDELVISSLRRPPLALLWLYLQMYARAFVAIIGVVALWQSGTVLLLSWKIDSLAMGLLRESVYCVSGTVIVIFFRPSFFYEEAGLNQANALDEVVDFPEDEDDEDYEQDKITIPSSYSCCWGNCELRCLLSLYGVILLWQGLEDILSVNDMVYIDCDVLFPRAKDPFLVYSICLALIGFSLLLGTHSFLGAFGLPPAVVMWDYLSPTWRPSQFFLSAGPMGLFHTAKISQEEFVNKSKNSQEKKGVLQQASSEYSQSTVSSASNSPSTNNNPPEN
eukprot:g46301.t1